MLMCPLLQVPPRALFKTVPVVGDFFREIPGVEDFSTGGYILTSEIYLVLEWM